jgi:hypothetical protein
LGISGTGDAGNSCTTTYSAAICDAMASGSQPTFIEACASILSTGMAANLPACL